MLNQMLLVEQQPKLRLLRNEGQAEEKILVKQ